MKKFIVLIASFTILFSCKTYTSIDDTASEALSVSDYCNSEYLGTITFHQEKRMGQSGIAIYGEGVTIANIQWDYKGSRKVGMTFDVIRCK
jgi:hypothetical protein